MQARRLGRPNNVDRREERAAIHDDDLERRALLTFRRFLGEQPLGDFRRIPLQKRRDVPGQIRDDHPGVDLRVRGHRHDGRGTKSRVGETVRYVNARVLSEWQLQRARGILEPTPHCVIPEPRL